MQTLDTTRTNIGDWDLTWGSYAFGGMDKVVVDLKLMLKPIIIGSAGAAPIGHRIVGLEGSIKGESREIDAGLIKAAIPWSGTAGNATPGTSGVSIPLVPAVVHQDLYALAKKLVCHPSHLASGDQSQDITLLLAAGTLSFGDRDGIKDNIVIADFSQFYPDKTLLPVLSYGYYGPPPG